MKTFVKFLLVAVCMSLVVTCSKNFETEEEISDAQLKSGKTHTVTVPFKAEFVGAYMPTSGVDPDMCGEYPMVRVFNEGGGTATHLGKFTHYFDFCVNDMTGEYPFDHMEAYFVAANGDSLFVYVSGQVMDGRLDHHPADVNSYFTDEWIILGGTGKFKGATGSGMTDDYNRDSFPANSFHHWKGTITMMKEKSKMHRNRLNKRDRNGW